MRNRPLKSDRRLLLGCLLAATSPLVVGGCSSSTNATAMVVSVSSDLGIGSELKVLSTAEQAIFLRTHLFELPLRHYRPLGDPTRHLRSLITLFSRARDEDVSPEEIGKRFEAAMRQHGQGS